jgi:RimJ/RimL family protein N-acetyltransferase
VLTPELPIKTERLLLRRYTEHDLDDLHDIQSRPDVARYLYWGAPPRA